MCESRGWLSRPPQSVRTRVVVVVVVVVAQPDCLPTLVRNVSSVTEPKSLEKVHPATNFTVQSLAASLVK